jgi:hypothetical protein
VQEIVGIERCVSHSIKISGATFAVPLGGDSE